MRISDWSSDVCSSDLSAPVILAPAWRAFSSQCSGTEGHAGYYRKGSGGDQADTRQHAENGFVLGHPFDGSRSEEQTSELQSLMRHSYAVFCLKKKNMRSKQGIHVREQQNQTHAHI